MLSDWKAISTAIIICTAVFLAWEELFVRLGIWGVNEKYTLSARYGNMVLEKWLFYLTWPFAFLILYDSLPAKNVFGYYAKPMSVFFLVFAILMGWHYQGRLYTTVCCYALAILVTVQLFVVKGAFLGRFYLAYFIFLLPALALESWLNGSFAHEPITWYDNMENSGFRVFTVPIENLLFLLLLFMLNVTVYERAKKPRHANPAV